MPVLLRAFYATFPGISSQNSTFFRFPALPPAQPEYEAFLGEKGKVPPSKISSPLAP